MDNFINKKPAGKETDDKYHGIEMATVEPVLLLYCQALTGKEVQFSAGKGPLPFYRNVWWTQLISGNPPNGQINVSLPANFSEYPSYDENFAWYKSAVTQQVGHVEFGSFEFCFERESGIFENLRYQILGEEVQGDSAFAKYFSLFENRALAARAFVAMENSRINYLVKYFYPGVKRGYKRMQEFALLALQATPGMPLRHIFCTLLEGIEINAVSALAFDELYTPLESATEIVEKLCHPAATVEDSAEAAIRIYNLALTIPENRFYTSAGSYSNQEPDGGLAGLEGGEFSGDFDAGELKLDLEKRDNPGKRTTMPMTAEELKKLANMKINISDVSDAQQLPSTGLSSADLPRGVNIYQFPQAKYQQVDRNRPGEIDQPIIQEPDEKLFHYDEWDFRTHSYMNEWCCVHEKIINEGSSYFYDNTLETRKALLADIKKQFEKLPAEMLYKAKNLEDGDEFDLDLVIGEIIDKRAGHTPSGKVYWKKQKIQRDVAVAFLLDMSGSTADLIKKNRTPMQYDESIKYDFMKFVMKQHRRIIDVEKEAIVLLCSAIEVLGDTYGIYGFSGHGRSKVQYMVIKDLNESFSEKIKRRVDQIAPVHGTRMGPAIRHTAAKLDACGASLKLMFLVSDGYPQDAMYGWDDDDKQYAINDTKMALIETARKNITPFCLTVDSSGTDYLSTMCQDIGYEVLEDIEALPQRLPTLYRKLSV
jgi:nitric oxide reductase NorD protein